MFHTKKYPRKSKHEKYPNVTIIGYDSEDIKAKSCSTRKGPSGRQVLENWGKPVPFHSDGHRSSLVGNQRAICFV